VIKCLENIFISPNFGNALLAAGAILKEQHMTEEHKITIQIPV